MILIISIIFSKNGILAASDVVNFTGFELPVAQTTAVRDNKIKNDEDRQALFIISCGGKFENKLFLDAENDYMNRYWIIL